MLGNGVFVEQEAPPGSQMKDEDVFADKPVDDLLVDPQWEAKVYGLKKIRESLETCSSEMLNRVFVLISDKSVPVQKECLDTVHALCKHFVTGSTKEQVEMATSVSIDDFTERLSDWWFTRCCPAIWNLGLLNQPRTKAIFLEALEDILFLIGDQPALDSPLVDVLRAQYLSNGTKIDPKSLKGVAIKTVTNVIHVIDKALQDFGKEILDVKALIPTVSALISSTDRNLREAVYNVCVTVYRIYRSTEMLTNAFADQKPIITEFIKRCELVKNDEPFRPRRFCRRSLLEQTSSSQTNQAEGNSVEIRSVESVPLETDNWDTLEETDLLGSFSSETFDKKVKELEKWNERKALIDELATTLRGKMKFNDGGSTSLALKGLLTTLIFCIDHDKNVAVQISAVKCCTAVARTIRNAFDTHLTDMGKLLVKSIIPKLKDKSKPLQTACIECLDQLFLYCLPLDRHADDICAGVLQKNPQQKLLILQWFGSVMSKDSTNSLITDGVQKSLKRLLSCAVECINDSNEAIRAASGIIILEGMAHNAKQVAFIIDQVKDMKKKATIHEVLARAGAKTAQSPSRGSSHNLTRSPSHNMADSGASRKDPPTRQPSVIHSEAIEPPISMPKAKAIVNPSWSVAASHDYRIDINDMTSADWKTKKAAINKMIDAIKSKQVSETDTAFLRELVSQVRKVLKTETQRNVLVPLQDLIGTLPKIFEQGGDGLHMCALQLLPCLMNRYQNEKNPPILTNLKNAINNWIQLLGVLDFSFYAGGGDNLPCTTKLNLTSDRIEGLYSLMETFVRQYGTVRAGKVSRHPDVANEDHTLNFVVQMFNDTANNERSTVMHRISFNILSCIDGVKSDFWEYLADMIENCPALANIQDFVHSKLSDEISRREQDSSAIALLDLPATEATVKSRLTSPHSWIHWTPESIRELAGFWRPQVSDMLYCAMFPEITSADIDITSAVNFWLSHIDFMSTCTSLETRLGNSPNFIRIFDDEKGIVDIFFQWLLLRLTDTTANLVMRTTMVRILQDTMARLIAARFDVRSLMENGVTVPPSIEKKEGTLPNALIEKLLETFLELLRLRSGEEDDEVYSVIQDVFLALAFVARDVQFLYALSLSKKARYPEVLELTAFILEQEGWMACSHLVAELTDFARTALSENAEPKVRDLASQCLVLILLSLSRNSASKAIKKLEEEIPGARKFVSRYTRAHQNLLNVFPRGGVMPQDDHCFEEKCISFDRYLERMAGESTNTSETMYQTARDVIPSQLEQPSIENARNYLAEFDELVHNSDIDQSLLNNRQDLEKKTWFLKKQLASMQLLDWYQELRREREGKIAGIESELTYWNGTRLLEYVQKYAHSDSSYIILEAKRLLQSDLSQLREATAVLLSANETNKLEDEEGEWMVPFSMDLICGCYAALRTVFQMEKFHLPDFIQTADLVTELTFEVCKSRKVLYQASPGLLCAMFSSVLICMGQHKYWEDLPGSKGLVEKLNSIMGVHLLGRVSPRTASCILECFYEYALPANKTLTQICQYDNTSSAYIDPDLFLRVSKRFVKKLNMKHPQISQLDPDSLYPITSNDRLNYLRIVDVNLPEPCDQMDLRRALLQCIKELIASLLIYTPALVGIYLRDKGFRSCLSEINERLAVQMVDAPPDLAASSVACLFIEPQMARSKFLSYRLETLMNENALPKERNCNSYMYLHKAYLANHQFAKLQLPEGNDWPFFSIDEVIERSPSSISLTSLDSTTAAGWTKKRDLFYSIEEGKKRTDVVPLEQLKEVSWEFNA